MIEQIPASSELLTERPRIRRRVIVALVLFVIGSALLHVSFGSSVAAMSTRWRNAGPSGQDAVTVITLSRSVRDVFMRPTPTPTPPPVIAKRTLLHLAQLKYREMGSAIPSRGRSAILAQRVALISLQRPEKSKIRPTAIAPRVAATEVPSVPSHAATSASADTGGTSDELASAVVWGDDNPVRVVRQAALPSGLTPAARPARVEIEVGPDGNIISVSLVQSSGDATFDAAALAAAKQSVYAPATLNGLPVHGTFTVDYPTGGKQSYLIDSSATTAEQAKARVIACARELGFDLVGIAGAEPFETERRTFERRAASGMLGQWRYPSDRIALIADPGASLPGARSIVCTATSYLTDDKPHDPYAPGLRGAISRHSWGRDYHRVIGGRLRALGRWIESEFAGAQCLACVDTGPLIDRAAAVRAGIGWFGKNANVLTREFGSWVLLGEVITTLDLPPDAPLAKNCGACVTCIDRCPTGAIGPDGAIDARRCISDLTQLNAPIPREVRPAIGNRIWGCDDCQSVCPVNERKERDRAVTRTTFAPLPDVGTSVDLPAVLRMTKSEYRRWFKPTSMAWRGKAVLQRNAAVALGNSRDKGAVPPLIEALCDRKPLVRGHAAWALGELGALGGSDARVALENLCASEGVDWVREEAEFALTRLSSDAGDRL